MVERLVKVGAFDSDGCLSIEGLSHARFLALTFFERMSSDLSNLDWTYPLYCGNF